MQENDSDVENILCFSMHIALQMVSLAVPLSTMICTT